MFILVEIEDLYDWIYAQADPSRRWAHMSFCWFCHVVAQMLNDCAYKHTMHALNSVSIYNVNICTSSSISGLFA